MSSPSLSTFDDIRHRRSQTLQAILDVERRWRSVVTEEPVLDSLKASVRADLVKAWYFRRVEQFFSDTRIKWNTIDAYRLVLGETVDEVEPKVLKDLCNKPTAFYWLQSAQRLDASGERSITQRIIFLTIYEEWFRCRHTEPDIDFGHFFANPVRISSTGPSTIHAVIEAHLSICSRVSHVEDKASQGETEITAKQLPLASPHHRLSPSYRAIVVLLDRLDIPPEGLSAESDGLISLHRFARRQTLLLARTGSEEGLSTPISFASLRSESYPLERHDVETNNIDVIRVSLAAAVKFIADVESREALANVETKPHPHRDTRLDPVTPEGYENNRQVCRDPDTWADATIDAAEEHGFDNIPETWQSIRRIKASSVGQEYCPFEYQHFIGKLRY